MSQIKDNKYGFGWRVKTFPKEYDANFMEALPDDLTDGYDFGGWEAPFHPGLIIVDRGPDTGPVDAVFADEPYVEGDITTPLNLEPKPFVNISEVLNQLADWSNMTDKEWDAAQLQAADNINRALLPGGKVRLKDDVSALQSVLNYLNNLGYKKVWESVENYDSGSPDFGEVEFDDDDEEVGCAYDIILQKPERKPS